MTIFSEFYRGHDMDLDQFIEAYIYNDDYLLVVTSESSSERETSVTFPISQLRRALNFTRNGYCEILDKWNANHGVDSQLLIKDTFECCSWSDHVISSELWYSHGQIRGVVECEILDYHQEVSCRLDVWEDILTGWDNQDWRKPSGMIYQTPYTSQTGNRWLDS